jgi:maltose O-acetyltransferase
MQPAPHIPPAQEAAPEPSPYDRLRAGQPYCALDPELALLRQRARRLAREYNATPEDEHLTRVRLLASLFGGLGDDPDVDAPLHVEYGRHIFAGHGFATGPGCFLMDAGRITLGDHVRLGAGVHIYAVARPLNPEQRAAGYEQAAAVVIGDHVWIGGNSIVNPGVQIGAGTTIGPGSVVLEDIPAGVFAAGNPCRVLRSLIEPSGDGAR